MKLNRLLSVFLALIICCGILAASKNQFKKERFSLTAYNFGSLGKLVPMQQLTTLHEAGYCGIILNSQTKQDTLNIDTFIVESRKFANFSVHAVMVRYNFDDAQRENWKLIVNKIANMHIELWIIFGKKMNGITDRFIEEKLREVVRYSAKKQVKVILYPHSLCYIASAEAALPFVEKINNPNLKLAVHLCHEIRAGNGSRMDAVFENVRKYIGAVTLAGTDSVADFSKPSNMDKSTIKPIGEGNFNMHHFIQPLKKSGYKGNIGFINFKIEENPAEYLNSSIQNWNDLLKNAK